MPAAPSGSLAAGDDCGMQSKSGHCSALKVCPPAGSRSAGANSGSFGPLIEELQVAALAGVAASAISASAAGNRALAEDIVAEPCQTVLRRETEMGEAEEVLEAAEQRV